MVITIDFKKHILNIGMDIIILAIIGFACQKPLPFIYSVPMTDISKFLGQLYYTRSEKTLWSVVNKKEVQNRIKAIM